MLGVVLGLLVGTADYELSWDAPVDCPNGVRVRAAVDRLLGDLEPTGPGKIDGTVRHDGERVVLDLRLDAGGGEIEGHPAHSPWVATRPSVTGFGGSCRGWGSTSGRRW